MKHDKSPTSGDVHLYADPKTAYTRLPMLYADCEGLQGGEIEPAANKLRRGKKVTKVKAKTPSKASPVRSSMQSQTARQEIGNGP